VSKDKKEIDTSHVEKAIYKLLTTKPYYGSLLQTFKITMSDKFPTAGVRFASTGRSIELIVNPDFFGKLTEKEREALLIHECSHVDRLHLVRIPALGGNHQLGNMAADLAINCYIKDLPEGCLYPSQYKLKDYETLEYYYERLKEQIKNNEKSDNKNDGNQPNNSPNSPSGENNPGDGGEDSPGIKDTLDVHEWDNSGLSKEDKIEIVENSIKRAIKNIGGAGNVPAHAQESLQTIKNMKPKNWHKELRKFIGKYVSGWDRERTWDRRNRRYGLQDAGTRLAGKKRLAIGIDTSGSMTKKDIERALSEINSIIGVGVEGYLIQFDIIIHKEEKLKKFQSLNVLGRGGTCFKEFCKRVDELHCDGAIIFTDGDDFGGCPMPKTPILWVYTSGEPKKPYPWGFKTYLE